MFRESNLLLVEDDLAVRQALTRVLLTENYRVFAASSCSEAILLYNQHQIDVVLLDLNLDPEDGWDVFHQLKLLRPDLPIFVTSGQPHRFSHASAHRAHGMLEKPIDPPHLVGLLNGATQPAIPFQRSISPSFPTPRKRFRVERCMDFPTEAPSTAIHSASEAHAIKLPFPLACSFFGSWRTFLNTIRSFFNR